MISVLFARRDSIYKRIDGCDVWDADRDALKWPGGNRVVAHPPCRGWGRLRHFAKPRPGEKECGVWAVEQVRKWGGVLEHPSYSSLWKACGMPRPGSFDDFGGWTLPVLQWWWGHKAAKATWLYFVGVRRSDLPEIPFRIGQAEYVVARSRYAPLCPELSKADRERTPKRFGEWLVSAVIGIEIPVRVASMDLSSGGSL